MRYYTRRRPHVDRCASAWLLKRFVDPEADFVFVEEGASVPGAIPFDISGAELGHRLGRCTFEAILAKHKLKDPVLSEIGRIIRSADLLDADETLEGPGVDLLFRGLLHLREDDHKVLALGEAVLDALYAAIRERKAARSRRRASRRK
jgi:hypothetical protein